MKEFRFSLEKYSGRNSKHDCPECGKRTFVRYKDNHTGEYVADYVGKCDRIDKCGYHYTPKMYFEKTGERFSAYKMPMIKPVIKKPQKPSSIDFNILESSLQDYENNNFALGLSQYFNWKQVVGVLRKYYVGTTRKHETVFWQVTRNRQVRTGKIILYDRYTLKRSSYVNWAHSKLRLKDFNLKQVFFGSHLLTDKSTPVAIAEGEKNAILGALFYPQYNWIATGGETLLNEEKLNALKDYDVTLFPDKGKAFGKWNKLAAKAVFSVKVNDTLERTGLPEGADIADLILDIRKRQRRNSEPQKLSELIRKNPHLKTFIEKFDLELVE